MSVKKRIPSSVESFIDKGAEVRGNKEKGFKNVLIRMPLSILNELDLWVEKKPWINRTQWIVEAIHEKLTSDINEEKENVGAGIK